MIFNREHIDNPYPLYATAREKHPVYWEDDLNAWLVLEHELVAKAFKDPRFSSNRISKFTHKFDSETLKPLLKTLSLTIIQRDEPDHTRIRNLVHYAFKRAAVEKYETEIRSLAEKLLAPGVDTGRLELVQDFAVPLPLLVISKIVGIPAEDRMRVKAWCDAYTVVALNFYANITEEQLEAGAAAVAEFTQYLKKKAKELRANPKDDLLTALVHAEEDGEKLTLDELVANTLVMLNAGNETTTCLIANGLLALMRNPDELARLKEDPALIPLAVEELLRYDSPIQFLGRMATEDVELGGETIRKGDIALLVMAASGRDPKNFENPDDLIVDRHPNHHMGFGNGHHICAGIQLARLEGRVAFETLLNSFSKFELEADDISYGRNVNLRCPVALPLSVTPAS